MNSVVEFLMECGHKDTAVIDKITLIMYCGNVYCNTNRKVISIETREWFFKCGQCRFGRYTGQSKTEATYRLNAHSTTTNHEGGEIWYRRVPAKSEFVRDLFGRRMKNTISPSPKIFADEPHMPRRFVTNVPLPGDKAPF